MGNATSEQGDTERAKAKFEQVWVLTVEHRHGTNVSLHKTELGARAALLEYVEEWWDSELPGQEQPIDSEAAISAYFDKVESESADYTPYPLGD